MKLIKNLKRYNPSILQLKKPQECIIEKNIKDSFKAESKSHGFFDILYKYEKTDYIYNILHSRRKRLHGKSLLKWVYQTSHFQQNLVASDLNVTFFNSLKTAFTLNSRVYSVKRKLSKLYPLALFKLAYKRTRLMPSQNAFFMQSGKNLPFRNLLFSMRNTKKKPMLSVRNSFSLFRLFIKRLRRTIFLFFKSNLFLIKKMALQRKSHRRPRRRKIGYIRYRTMGFIFKKIGFKKKLLKPFAKLTKKKKKRMYFFSFHYRKKDFRIFPYKRWHPRKKKYQIKNKHHSVQKKEKSLSIYRVLAILTATQGNIAYPEIAEIAHATYAMDELSLVEIDNFTQILRLHLQQCKPYNEIAKTMQEMGFNDIITEDIFSIAADLAENWPSVDSCFTIPRQAFEEHCLNQLETLSDLQFINEELQKNHANKTKQNHSNESEVNSSDESDVYLDIVRPTPAPVPKSNAVPTSTPDQYYTIKVEEPVQPNPNAGGFEIDPTKWSLYTWAGISFVVILVGYYAYVAYYAEKESSEIRKLSSENDVSSKEDWSNVNASAYEEQEILWPAGIGTACSFLLVTLAKLFPYVISSWYLGCLAVRYMLRKA